MLRDDEFSRCLTKAREIIKLAAELIFSFSELVYDFLLDSFKVTRSRIKDIFNIRIVSTRIVYRNNKYGVDVICSVENNISIFASENARVPIVILLICVKNYFREVLLLPIFLRKVPIFNAFCKEYFQIYYGKFQFVYCRLVIFNILDAKFQLVNDSNVRLGFVVAHLLECDRNREQSCPKRTRREDERQPRHQRRAALGQEQIFHLKKRDDGGHDDAAEGHKRQRRDPASILFHTVPQTLPRTPRSQPMEVLHV